MDKVTEEAKKLRDALILCAFDDYEGIEGKVLVCRVCGGNNIGKMDVRGYKGVQHSRVCLVGEILEETRNLE